MERNTVLEEYKHLCVAEGLVPSSSGSGTGDIQYGIHDDGTLLRFLRARNYDVDKAFEQYKAAIEWRQTNRLIELYESIDVMDYEETRRLYTHWTGRRDRKGFPLFLFEIGHLTPSVMGAHAQSCSSKDSSPGQTESQTMLRLFCTYENLTRFVLPTCSAVPSSPDVNQPITNATCIVDISGVSLLQFWRLREHMQAASTLATAHYPETLGQTYIVGAPPFFSTIWSWINRWFDQNTVSKFHIVPSGEERPTLSQIIDPVNIPHKYGGQLQYEFGMLPDLDDDIKEMVTWLRDRDGNVIQDIPKGPMRWVNCSDGRRIAKAVGTENGASRDIDVMSLQPGL